jgi:hypothetical protein
MSSENETPTELLIRTMEELDEVEHVVVLLRRKGGGMCYRSTFSGIGDTLGWTNFCRLAMEHDIKQAWAKEDD